MVRIGPTSASVAFRTTRDISSISRLLVPLYWRSSYRSVSRPASGVPNVGSDLIGARKQSSTQQLAAWMDDTMFRFPLPHIYGAKWTFMRTASSEAP